MPSPKVATYDLKPEMSAPEVTGAALEQLAQDKYRVMIINYANPDMVGHTGNMEAAVKAVETVDSSLGKLVEPCWPGRGGYFYGRTTAMRSI